MVSQASLANAIRVLTMDSVQAANSGHPGAPMGMAEMAVALWDRHLKHNPADPKWPDRDRFVLSNGHGSMLLYALLHLTGYDLPLEELKNFRQLHSKTPGHPEYGLTVGVETTTGPLGQGIGNSVGLALAEKLLATEFNREGFPIVDHYNYVFVGDGCLMEGISHEVCSLAGTWKLSKLIAFFDDNGMSIDGAVEGWFTDDTPRRFEAYGWNVIRGVDGHDVDAVDLAICAAKSQHDKPTLICCKTVIGKGSPNKAGTIDVHGAALGKDEVAATRVALGITEGAFEVPEAVRAAWDGRAAGATRQAEWQTLFAAYRAAHPKLATEFVRRMKGELHPEFSATAAEALQAVVARNEAIATRKASQNAIQALVPVMPELIGGSADLTGSNLTNWKGCRSIRPEAMAEGGNYIYYGVREFGMVAIMNGLVLHGGFRPFGGTYLMFSEYARNAIRMAALMCINPIFVFTHDSIGVGEDGPTHQPIEQAATLRMVPNLDVWRPCNSVETFVAWQIAIEHRSTPTALILTRQNLPHLAHHSSQTSMIRRGGYVLKDCSGAPKAVIIATGSEVCLALDAQQALAEKGIAVRVVSMPSSFMFDQQDVSYRESVLPRSVPRVAVEAGITGYWRQYVGLEGAVVGIDRFGESAPVSQVFEYFGITAAAVLTAVEGVIAG
ncbi:MAG: transketolase [Propionivibrio sp.]|uniref:transketolase n=1 Tax=Propionivibrio sp. TaxID=2212460 RepID=UPI001A3CB254|nr:transketolase [Propionivibrio sp.]MBL8413936.1 transketolase [Propionivibrio sp.]